ncbi:MAG TPA: hypothetical protein VKR32_09400 [Puia sp.]|nr:hypothetical protein [Puia sp.]
MIRLSVKILKAVRLKLFLACTAVPVTTTLIAQEIIPLASTPGISIRGLSVLNDSVIWVSGSSGTVGISTNGGNSFRWIKVPGFENRDFRDIEGFDSNVAIIMGVAYPAIILKTIDGGLQWKTVFIDSTKGMFLDAMDFSGSLGAVIGDPVGGRIFISTSKNSGDSWAASPISRNVAISDGEAFFASSGTNIRIWRDSVLLFASGGKKSSFFLSSKMAYRLPMQQGRESTGANSLAIFPQRNATKGIVVGGDFANDTSNFGNCVLLTLSPFSMSKPETPPHGYRSAVDYISADTLICCGTSGVDVSIDGGKNWRLISKESFHVCQKSRNGKMVVLAGSKGRVAKLSW